MSGIDWFKFLLFALIVMVALMGVFGFLKLKKASRSVTIDTNAWFLIILLMVAILSISSFIAFVFLSGSTG